MTVDMAAMAVLNHTEEELDDDIASNLSLNLMVSDNEDGGSPRSDHFDKLDSRNESPEESSNCEINEDPTTNVDTKIKSGSLLIEMKDDLQQLRDITGDSSWSALDDGRGSRYAEERRILRKIECKQTTISNTTERSLGGDNIHENSDLVVDSNDNKGNSTASADGNSITEKKKFNKKIAVNDVEMEVEERLLNDAKDNEKDAYDCENYDEDALLSDARDEDLLQITEERSTENDTADFLKRCQEEQEANENSSSSTEKAEDNIFDSASEYEENNTDSLEPDDIVLNDNYENSDIDNDTNDVFELNSTKSENEEPQERGNEEFHITNDAMNEVHITDNKNSLLHSKHINESNTSGIVNILNSKMSNEHKIANLDVSGEHTEVNKNEFNNETSDKIEYYSLAPLSPSHKEINDHDSKQYSKSGKNSEIETSGTALMASGKMNIGLNKRLLRKTKASAKKITITNITSCDKRSNNVSNEIQPSTNADDAVQSSNKRDIIYDKCFSESEVVNKINLPGLPGENDLPLDTSDADETEQMRTQNDTIVSKNVQKQYAIRDGITTSTTEDIDKANKSLKNCNLISAVAEINDKSLVHDDDSIEIDDMELDSEPISFIKNNAPCINKESIVLDSSDKVTDETRDFQTVEINNYKFCVDAKADTTKENDSEICVNFLSNNTNMESAPMTRNLLDNNIINLIDDFEPEVMDDVAPTDNCKLQNQIGDDIKDPAETTELQMFKNTGNIAKFSGIEGDNKDYEDMDIEEINPYKEPVARPNGSVLKQMLVMKYAPATIPSTSPMVSLPSGDGKENVKRLSNTIVDNNVPVVSPQPGDKRLSSDCQLESAKRRRMATSDVLENRHKYLESFKQAMSAANWSKIGRRQLEEFVTQKILETIHYKTEIGQLHKKCMEYKQNLENLRTNSLILTKQVRDMNTVHIKLEREINLLKARSQEEDRPLVAVKITRSVGLQVLVQDPRVQRRSRSLNMGSVVRTTVQKQAAQVVQQPQQQPVQVQQGCRVTMTVNGPPQLQTRPARPMVSAPSVVSPAQTRTMSRNKKIPLSAMVNTMNLPPIRSISQQQSSTTTSSTVNIPITRMNGPTILNKTVNVTVPPVAVPIITTPTKESSKGVIDLTDEDDIGKKASPVKATASPQQQQRFTLMSTVVNGHQVLLRVDGGGPLPSKTATVLNNFVQSSPAILQQRTIGTSVSKTLASVPQRTRTSTSVQTSSQTSVVANGQPPSNTPLSPGNTRRFRHPAPLPAPPASQSLIKGNKPIPPKPTVTVSKSSNGIVVKWNMPSMLSLFEKIVRYELFVYQVTKSPPRTDSWGKINDVGALDLPMAVSLTEFAEGNRYYFAVRAVDELDRLGPFSEPQTIVF